MQRLAATGLIVPGEIPSDNDTLPLDFTLTSNQEIGSIHSRYAVRHAHAIYHAALAGSSLAMLRRDLRIAQSQFRLLKPKQPKNITDAEMEDDEHITHLLNRVSRAEMDLKLIESVAQGYDDIRAAASREISRRQMEHAPLD